MDVNAIVLILILILLISVISGTLNYLRSRGRINPPSINDLVPYQEAATTEEHSHEDALLRCLARMAAIPKVLAALYDATDPLTITEIHRRFPKEDDHIPVNAVQRALKVLMNGPFVDAVDGDLIHGRYKLRTTGRELYKAIIDRGFTDALCHA